MRFQAHSTRFHKQTTKPTTKTTTTTLTAGISVAFLRFLMYRTSGSLVLSYFPTPHPSSYHRSFRLFYLSLVHNALFAFAGGLRSVSAAARPPHTIHTHTQTQQSHRYTHTLACRCMRLLTCSHVIRFILTCFHVTKFDFVSQTTRHNEPTTTLATKLWPLNWPRANRDTAR